MTDFNLPDLGEGLPDAEIIKWWVEEGATVAVNDVLVEVATAKATVEVPSPFDGKIVKLHGGPGDVIDTGRPLVTFALEGEEVPAPKADKPKPVEKSKQAEAPAPETPAAPAAPAAPETTATVFHLPDLGEGLQEAEIVQWMVAEGDGIELGETMVEVSTDKAVVEIPAPYSGAVARLHGAPGDMIATGAPLIEITETGGPRPVAEPETAPVQEDSGTVVGEITVGTQVTREATTSAGGIAISAAARALARQLKVDLDAIAGSGAKGAITLGDIRAAAGSGAPTPKAERPGNIRMGPAARATARALGLDAGEIAAAGTRGVITKADVLAAARQSIKSPYPVRPAVTGSGKGAKAAPGVRAHARRKGVDIAAVSPSGFLGNVTIADIDGALSGALSVPGPGTGSTAYQGPVARRQLSGRPERVTGPRRAMARAMTRAQAEVALTTIFDDADISAWAAGSDITMRIVRAIVAAATVEPALNAWFDPEKMERTLHAHVNLGVAVDAPTGLFVPVVRHVEALEEAEIRRQLDRLRGQVADQTIAPADMRGATVTLSNYGMIAGRFATPVVSPPEVAIIGIGGLYHQLAMTAGGIENRRLMPVSLSFDHRACTGGDSARFLSALLDDLSLPG